MSSSGSGMDQVPSNRGDTARVASSRRMSKTCAISSVVGFLSLRFPLLGEHLVRVSSVSCCAWRSWCRRWLPRGWIPESRSSQDDGFDSPDVPLASSRLGLRFTAHRFLRFGSSDRTRCDCVEAPATAQENAQADTSDKPGTDQRRLSVATRREGPSMSRR